MTDESDSRTYYLPTVVGLAIASAIAWWSLAQVWGTAKAATGLAAAVEQTGSEMYPASLAGAWIGLACVLAILATSGVARRVIAGVVALCAIAVLAAPVAAILSGPNGSSYWLATCLAGVVMLASAGCIWAFSPRWRSLSSRQGGSGKSGDSMWDALDRGEDPTERDRL